MATFRAANDCHLIFTMSQNRLTTGYIRALKYAPKVVKTSPCSSTLPRTVRSCRSAQKCEWRDSQRDRNNRRNAGTVVEQPTANIADLWQDFKCSCLH